ncbi:hypothetical protein [Mycobacterium sp. URHB0021]
MAQQRALPTTLRVALASAEDVQRRGHNFRERAEPFDVAVGREIVTVLIADFLKTDRAYAAGNFLLDNGSIIQEATTSPTRKSWRHCFSLPATRNSTSGKSPPKLPTHPGGKFGQRSAV